MQHIPAKPQDGGFQRAKQRYAPEGEVLSLLGRQGIKLCSTSSRYHCVVPILPLLKLLCHLLLFYVLRLMNKQATNNKLHGLSPRANYTDRATAASRRSGCQHLRIEGATWSA
jgi:hypothetical protein